MPILIFPENKNKNNYRNKNAIHNVIYYMLNDSKLEHGIVGAIGLDASCSKQEFVRQIEDLQRYYGKNKGRLLHHFIVSFSKEESCSMTIQDYLIFGYDITEYFNDEYQIVFALHENTENGHIHFFLNPVNVYTGKKFHWQRKDSREVSEWINQIANKINQRKI